MACRLLLSTRGRGVVTWGLKENKDENLGSSACTGTCNLECGGWGIGGGVSLGNKNLH